MVMKTFQFKTNIQCESCLEKVAPYLNANNEIRKWEVNIRDQNKILTIETDHLTPEMIQMVVRNAGYSAEPYKPDHSR
jgi:copper chaperone